MNIKKILLTGGAIMLAGSAFAADLPSRRAPATYIAPRPVFTWTGFYIGVNAGAAFRVGNNNNNNNGFFGNGGGNGNSTGFVGGGQLGYNWQSGPIVFGVEGDAQYRSNIGNNNNNNGFFGGGNNNSNNGGFYGTARGRLGYAFSPAFMLYVTGGAAFGTVAHNNNGGFNPFLPAAFNNFGGFGNNGGNNFRVGYAAGGGAEYAFSPNWSVKAEALYNDLGRGNQGGGFNFGGNNSRNTFVVARIGVNYKFNMGGPSAVVAKY